MFSDQAFGIALLVGKGERIGWNNVFIPRFERTFVEHLNQPIPGGNIEVISALGTDVEIGFGRTTVDRCQTTGTLEPKPVRDDAFLDRFFVFGSDFGGAHKPDLYQTQQGKLNLDRFPGTGIGFGFPKIVDFAAG